MSHIGPPTQQLLNLRGQPCPKKERKKKSFQHQNIIKSFSTDKKKKLGRSKKKGPKKEPNPPPPPPPLFLSCVFSKKITSRIKLGDGWEESSWLVGLESKISRREE